MYRTYTPAITIIHMLQKYIYDKIIGMEGAAGEKKNKKKLIHKTKMLNKRENLIKEIYYKDIAPCDTVLCMPHK